MEALLNQVKSLVQNEEQMRSFLILALVMTVGSLIFGFIGRFAFGKKSVLSQIVSSAIGILFIYAVTVVIHSYGLNLKFLVSPLPFVTISDEWMGIFPIVKSDYVAICGELLNMIILAFLVNIVNQWMPQGKKTLAWLFFRILSVALGMVLFAVANYLLTSFLPEGLLTWAPVILLGLLVIMLLVGALKGLVGAVLVSVNPLVAFLYTFFFANLVGKMLTRAMLTTLLLSALVYALNYLGIAGIAIGTSVLVAYIPMLLLLLVLWYIVGKLL